MLRTKQFIFERNVPLINGRKASFSNTVYLPDAQELKAIVIRGYSTDMTRSGGLFPDLSDKMVGCVSISFESNGRVIVNDYPVYISNNNFHISKNLIHRNDDLSLVSKLKIIYRDLGYTHANLSSHKVKVYFFYKQKEQQVQESK